MRLTTSRLMAATAGFLALASSAKAEVVYGLATGPTGGDNIITFDSANPASFTNAQFVNGLSANESLVGIDIRPSNGLLYGVGSFNNIYTINPASGVATKVATLSTGLSGFSFDIDFNPVADTSGAASLRVVSDTGRNLAVNVNTGAVTTQTAINASYANPLLAGAAYTNNVFGATTTSLYTIDSSVDSLNTQNPPANGTQTQVAGLKDSAGAAVDVSTLLGFDISGATGIAYVALQQTVNGVSQFSTINLATGQLTGITIGSPNSGKIGGGLFVRDIAVVPEPATLGLAGVAVVGLIARRRKTR